MVVTCCSQDPLFPGWGGAGRDGVEGRVGWGGVGPGQDGEGRDLMPEMYTSYDQSS